ncbi:MAG TPA: GNAT family N-acetyltransferase [Pirellulales bacterium]|nr:GNAT family N-acetyltransferase [Pirellulales bacterium]
MALASAAERSEAMSASASLKIIPMTEADIESVIVLWNTTPGVGLNESDSPAQLRLFLARNPGMSLVARDGSRLIAAVMCGHDGRRGFLYHMAVLPEYRRRGLGRQLIDRCLKTLAAEGILKCNALVLVDNDGGQEFWRRGDWHHRSDLILFQRSTTDKNADSAGDS